jgi:hypothetical protein
VDLVFGLDKSISPQKLHNHGHFISQVFVISLLHSLHIPRLAATSRDEKELKNPKSILLFINLIITFLFSNTNHLRKMWVSSQKSGKIWLACPQVISFQEMDVFTVHYLPNSDPCKTKPKCISSDVSVISHYNAHIIRSQKRLICMGFR